VAGMLATDGTEVMSADQADAAVPYDRDVLVSVLVHHRSREDYSCLCGWSSQRRVWPNHIADVYEQAVRRD
jgi:hypothetical protein